MVMACFCDASWGTRKDGSSQGGYVIVLADQKFLQGEECWLTVLDFKSFKLKRKCRSSLSAECQAFSEAQDQVEYVKLFFQEMMSEQPLNLKQYSDFIHDGMKMTMVTDCKSLYDAIERSIPQNH